MPHLYSRRQILLCKAGQLVGQPVVMHQRERFAPAAQYVLVSQGVALLLQDIQAVDVPVLVDAPVLLHSDHKSDESPQ